MRAKAQRSRRQLEALKEKNQSQPIANARFAHKQPFAATSRNGSKWSLAAGGLPHFLKAKSTLGTSVCGSSN